MAHRKLKSANDDDWDLHEPEDEIATALITAILLEHFGDGLPVHADVVMDTVQYRLARDETMAARARRDGCYCVWADRRASRAYRQCLARLVRSGRIRVVYDCGCGCGTCLEDNSDGGGGLGNGCTVRRKRDSKVDDIGYNIMKPAPSS